MASISTPDSVWIPEADSDELDVDAARGIGHAALFRLDLKAIDDRLDIVWARPGAEALEGGYWYIVRRNPRPMHDTYWKVCTPDGGYADPGIEHLEALRARDQHRHGSMYAAHRRREEERERQGKKRLAETSREFREKLEERLDHLFTPKAFIDARMADQVAAVTKGGVALPTNVRSIDSAVSEKWKTAPVVVGGPMNRAQRRRAAAAAKTPNESLRRRRMGEGIR